jgi:transcriptional regulator with XRE-family HTH domain
VNLAETAAARLAGKSGSARQTRERANVGLRELARYIQVSPSSLSKYERGQSRPNAQVAERWAQALAEMKAALPADDTS